MCGGCLRLSVLSIVEGQKVESPGKFAFTCTAPILLDDEME
ncbi:hypothetical protein AI3045V2_0326 [Enterobacter cloacae]|jgi:hypothetical protein|nr:hypothetical protein AI2704V1_0325 [Enterobacter cloacae]CAE6283111.1 hypothetical protein AI2710V1_0383 [Enterobacter cloacae]CAF3108623.1 hypothetical protein AI2992V5_0326 [Enterobacter cloacae]CAF9506864.1 hypothetical protein AI3045V2_0326 [Enterobacter cloacae]CAG0219290.1 hypothetical protein AI3050V1_0380 [Enterobacter cloacae]